MVLLTGFSQKSKAMCDYHEDEDPPGHDRTHDRSLQKVEAEETGQPQKKHASSQVAEALSGFLGPFDEPEDLEQVVGLR